MNVVTWLVQASSRQYQHGSASTLPRHCTRQMVLTVTGVALHWCSLVLVSGGIRRRAASGSLSLLQLSLVAASKAWPGGGHAHESDEADEGDDENSAERRHAALILVFGACVLASVGNVSESCSSELRLFFFLLLSQ